MYQGQQHTSCRTPSFRNTLGTCGLKAGHQLKPSCGGSTSHSSAQSPKAKPVGQAASSPPVGGSSSTDVVVNGHGGFHHGLLGGRKTDKKNNFKPLIHNKNNSQSHVTSPAMQEKIPRCKRQATLIYRILYLIRCDC